MINITYFVHGTTTDNKEDISSGWKDVGLSELGVRQSIELKENIKDKKFDVVFCSDLKRAVDSAKIVFEGAPIIADIRLRECNYGKFNGKSSLIVEPMQEKNITESFPEGESCEDVKNRIADFLEFLHQNYDGNPRTQRAEQSSHDGNPRTQRAEQSSHDGTPRTQRAEQSSHDGKHVAIVSHKAPQLALDVLLHGKTWEQALAEDWRKTKAWRPGWEYTL